MGGRCSNLLNVAAQKIYIVTVDKKKITRNNIDLEMTFTQKEHCLSVLDQ